MDAAARQHTDIHWNGMNKTDRAVLEMIRCFSVKYLAAHLKHEKIEKKLGKRIPRYAALVMHITKKKLCCIKRKITYRLDVRAKWVNGKELLSLAGALQESLRQGYCLIILTKLSSSKKDNQTVGTHSQKGAHQGEYLHALLHAGQDGLQVLFPGITKTFHSELAMN